MNPRALMLLLAVAALGWALRLQADEKTHKLTTVSPRKMADSLHAVIAADRQAYAELVMERALAGEARIAITTSWRDAHGLPVHAQLLRTAAQKIQQRGAEFSYTLRSLTPLNPNNGPQTEVEQAGLEHVAQHPDENYYQEEELGGRSYFTAVYADRATLSSCAGCHNSHPQSKRRDLKAGDVMGAIVVRVPLEF